MTTLNIVVVGAGHLGKFHAQKIAAMEGAALAGVIDTDQGKAHALASQYGVEVFDNLPATRADAAIVSATTTAHASIAIEAMRQGMHVLVEKPIASSLKEAQDMLECATAHDRILSVGHTERFNPAVSAALHVAQRPRYITAERLSPFSGRSLDTDVILDLMIHDLDILATLVKSPLKSVQAVGVPVLTDSVDMASARLEFTDGTVAELRSGRVSLEPCRKIRIFTRERYVSIDCAAREVKAVNIEPPKQGESMGTISGEPIHVGDWDPLESQLSEFISSIHENRSPRVDGQAGLRALELAFAIKGAMTNPAANQSVL